MAQNRIAPFVVIAFLFVALQAALIAAECGQTPLRVAERFIEDYYYLDATMQKHLCAQLAADGQAVDNFLYAKESEAARRGLPVSYLRHMFTSIHLKTESQSDKTVRIHIRGTTRVAINPAFKVVGQLFRIGQNYPVDITLDLVKEEGRWRVCGHPFNGQPQA